MKIVVKIGGAALEDKSTLYKCAHAVVDLARDGHKVAVVHGGGSALTRTLKLLGKQSEFVNGLRITDAETRDVALMVLAGIVNKSFGGGNQSRREIRQLGLCGGDGMSFRARKKKTEGYDLGFVGEICSVEPRWLEAIWGEGGIPVHVVAGTGLRWRILQHQCGPDGRGLRRGVSCGRAYFSNRCAWSERRGRIGDSVAQDERSGGAWLRLR